MLFKLLIIHLFLCQCDAVWTKFELVRPWDGQGSEWELPFVKINGANGGPPVAPSAEFGKAVANIGDLDGNGIDDIMVGARGEVSIVNGTMSSQAGAVYVLFMYSSGENHLAVQSYQRISSNDGNGPPLLENAFFGTSVCAIGDVDGDGVMDVAVGAPGARVSATYILFMNSNGTVKDRVILGSGLEEFEYVIDNVRWATGSPPLGYFANFGSMVAPMGDFDKDGIPDLIIGAADASGGFSKVYMCFLNSDGSIKSYVKLSSGENGTPEYGTFDKFGSSVVMLGDVNNDNITDIAVGAEDGRDPESSVSQAGQIYICMLNEDATIKAFTKIDALAQADKGFALPLVQFDNCGAAVTSIGDVNKDHIRGKYAPQLKDPSKGFYSIPDVIVGCPQGGAGTLPGRSFIFYLTPEGGNQGYTELPHALDKFNTEYVNTTIPNIAPELKAKDQFGTSADAYMDLDGNGMKEVIFGAPGDHDNGYNTGAIYIFFLRRRRFHPVPFDYWMYYITLLTPIAVYCTLCCGGLKLFFWYFRRKPDEIEIMVKNSNIEITKNRERTVAKFDSKVYVDEY